MSPVTNNPARLQGQDVTPSISSDQGMGLSFVYDTATIDEIRREEAIAALMQGGREIVGVAGPARDVAGQHSETSARSIGAQLDIAHERLLSAEAPPLGASRTNAEKRQTKGHSLARGTDKAPTRRDVAALAKELSDIRKTDGAVSEATIAKISEVLSLMRKDLANHDEKLAEISEVLSRKGDPRDNLTNIDYIVAALRLLAGRDAELPSGYLRRIRSEEDKRNRNGGSDTGEKLAEPRRLERKAG